jgi:hypothetical protein
MGKLKLKIMEEAENPLKSRQIFINKKMKHLMILIIFLTSVKFMKAQQNQIYTGNFSDDQGVVGKAKYSYFEKDYVKIKNGSFEFSYNYNGINRILKGGFVEGLRVGNWTSFIAGRGLEVTITGNFQNGFPDGQFLYEAKYNGSTYQKLDVTFKNGLIVGQFNYEDKRKGETVKGMITQEGFMDGDWIIIEGNKEFIQKYENGFYNLYIERNVNDGKITRKDDYLLKVKNLPNEDILTEDFEWNITNSDDIYGTYVQKLWSNWDPISVGGIAENPIEGMYFKKQSAKKALSSFNLIDNEYNKIIKSGFDKQDSLKNIFQIMNKYYDELNNETNLFNQHKENILSNEIKLRLSNIEILYEIKKHEIMYKNKNIEYQSLIDKINLAITNINTVNKSYQELKQLNYNGKYFSGLIYPSRNQFNLNEFIQIASELKIVKSRMNYQNAKDLITSYKMYDSLLFEITNKANAIFLNSYLDFEDKQFNPSDNLFVSSMKNVLEILSNELKIISEQNIKLIEIKRGENIQKKLNVLQDYYFSELGSEFNLSYLIKYISKISALNKKVGEIIISEERAKTISQEVKKEENIQQLEIIFLNK